MEFPYFFPYGMLLRFNYKNDMGCSELRFIFGQDLSKASWKYTRNSIKNSLLENMSILDHGYKPPYLTLLLRATEHS